MEAIILAGGTGTRLRDVVSDVPKPMAPVRGRPFLEWQLLELERQGFQRVVLSVGYLAEKIRRHFGLRHGALEIDYAQEDQPLGTGGAVRLALRKVQSPCCVILNGDSFFDINLAVMEREHAAAAADVTLALKPMKHCARYGTVKMKDGRVTAFAEKSDHGPEEGLINGGVYLLPVAIFDGLALPERFSLERDFLTPFCASLHFHGSICDGFFIDIGVPDDYLRAQSEPRFQKA